MRKDSLVVNWTRILRIAFDGAPVGACDGLEEGVAEGTFDGCFDGLDEIELVGTGDGLADGDWLGFLEGDWLGLDEG